MKRILIIDDDLQGRHLLRAILETEGYICQEAVNGAEALDILKKVKQFDLIITDQKMPVMTGLEFLEYLRKCSTLSSPPVIMLTGNPSSALRQAAGSAGVSAIFGKPLSNNRLLSKVSQILFPSAPAIDNSTGGV